MTIEPGCYVKTKWGRAVCTEVKDLPTPPEGYTGDYDDAPVAPWCYYRYPASNGIMWVQNADPISTGDDDDRGWSVSYDGPADDTSRHVLTLTGAYGQSL